MTNFLYALLFAQFAATQPTEISAVPKPEHTAWNLLLQKHVSATGAVNYKGFQADKAALDAYLKTLAENTPQDDWTREREMAYWLNAYNAFTVKLIADHYPLGSIQKLDGGKTWDVQRIMLGGKKYSLNQIENDILRPRFKDARIHFAINCAAKSCPPLLNRAFEEEGLNTLLDERTKAFISDPKFNQISASKASVSKIFEWYAADFGDLRKYLNQFSKAQLKANAVIKFKDYDWSLNE
ncbi:MAG: DUF547 domain-containing protein [Saprospiraceae bacterium]